MLVACDFPETLLRGPAFDGARALVVFSVPAEGEANAWAFEAPLSSPQVVPLAAQSELYALASGCDLSVLNLGPGKVELAVGPGTALPVGDTFHRWLGADLEAAPLVWSELESRRVDEGLRLAAPRRDWCAEAEDTVGGTIDLRGPDLDDPLTGVNPAFALQLGPDEVLVALRNGTGDRFAYFRVTSAGPERLELSLPVPMGGFVAADGEWWIVAGQKRQLFRGRPEVGFTAQGSTRAIALNTQQVWIDGAPDGSELIVLGGDGVAERYQQGRWSELGRFEPFLDYYWGSVLWLGPGEALFTTGLNGQVAYQKRDQLTMIDPPTADRIFTLARHPSLGILAGTEGGDIFRLTLPTVWTPHGAAVLPNSILGIAPLGDGLITTGLDNGLAIFHPRIGYCGMGTFSDARTILRLGESVLLVHRAYELDRPVSLEVFSPLPLSRLCEALR